MKYTALTLAIILIAALSFAVIRTVTNHPPEEEVKEAGRMLAEAQFEKAPGYAAHAFRKASVYYDSAMIEWKYQNDRFIVFRDYDRVREYAQSSIRTSEEAIHRARKRILDTEGLLDIRLEHTGELMEDLAEDLGRFPLDEEHRDRFAMCRLHYAECLQAYRNKNYSTCRSKLDSVDAGLKDVAAHYRERISDYFRDYPDWKAMAEQSILHSKKNQTHVLIVDKIARQLLVYKNGKLLKHYPIELGANWVGDKMQQGDKSTPEGLYKVVDKKQNGQTKYHKALLLDYPNDADRKRFARNKKSGVIHPDAGIGNLIEIHGSGGRGTDWTDGCIALWDTHMDELYAFCPEGTRVTILGSTKPLNELSYPLE